VRHSCSLRLLSWNLALLAAVFATPCFAQTEAPTVRVPDSVTLEANISYDQYKATVLDIMQPMAPSKEKRSGVIMFHGGGWIRSSKETMMSAFCLPYLEHGFVVCNVEYRVASMATAPAAVTDALKAAQWFFDHADKYHVDTKRIIVTGASSGGHLALMVGMTPESAGLGPAVKVAAIVNGYGIADVADLLEGPHKKSWATEWLPQQEGRAELAKRVSPMTYVRKDLPPILTIQGANDATVPLQQNVSLTKALKEAGVDAEMITVPNAGHGFSRQQWSDVNGQVFSFLEKHGILKSSNQ
jgi:acetyl esterase/lipase